MMGRAGLRDVEQSGGLNMSAKKDSYGNTWESEVTEDGEFVRHQTSFRSQIRADGSTHFAPGSGRYHLYVSYACPWAHRTLGSLCADEDRAAGTER
jgi:hypothetical protein